MLNLHDHPTRRCYVACEGQSEPDYTMPVRKLTYDGVEYSDQILGKENKGKKQDGLTRPLIPVFHLTLYMGEKQWISKHTLQQMMDIPDELIEFRDLLPDYHTYIVDIHEQDPELYRTEWKDVFSLMKYRRKKEELKEYMKAHIDEIRNLSMDTRMLMAVLLDQYEIVEENIVEVKEVCEAWDGAIALYKEEIKDELTKEVQEELREELKELRELRDGIKDEMREEIQEEIKNDVKEETEERVCRLNLRLIAEKKFQDLERASRDRGFRQQLYAVYQL
ncbi:MAG: Rpn family recombination-promoting nuclease/putative transposase [Blautia sp.]|nr:Rpn family recombination-promoting nuclease/putative transposase [Blautia sp.]MDY4000717.1 Rpn family recombination-promoting nuclease/putative transposase [Blautia sp.]